MKLVTIMVRRKPVNPARYIYSDPKPEKAKFLGRWKNGHLNPKPNVEGNPWNEIVALSKNNKNDYPPLNRIISADEIRDSNNKLVGYAFRYR